MCSFGLPLPSFSLLVALKLGLRVFDIDLGSSDVHCWDGC